MLNKTFIFLLFSLLLSFSIFAQDNLSLKGYIKGMTAMQTMGNVEDWSIENTLHNRFDFNWYINEKLTFTVGLRNRIISGDNISQIPDYRDYVSHDNAYFDLSLTWANEKSWIGLSQLDRLNIDYSIGNFQITLGRQRINWGQSFVWNPNDLFNTYSYFDFDYEEKPGSDAIRMQYYMGESSKIELSASLNADKKITSAMLYRFNTNGYDIQFLGGIFSERDYVIGGGWSGSIGGGGFNGELTYYRTIKNFSDYRGKILATLHYDYTFKNTLNLQFETLYNGFGAKEINRGLEDILFTDLGPVNLFPTKVAFFAGIGYDLSPLIRANLSGMYGPNGNFIYAGPTIMYAMSETLELAAIGQYFSVENKIESLINDGNSIFVRLKWSF